MAGSKKDLVIPWPFAANKVGTNQDTSLLKLIAMLTMLIDHSGKMLFPQYPIMRVIGRIAFPIYAYCIAVGCVYTHDALRYFKRIVLLALISQPIYAVALAHTTNAMYAYSFAEQPVRAAIQFYVESWSHPSILLTLAFGILLIWCLREKQMLLFFAVGLFCYQIQGKLDYGFKGLMLMLLFYATCPKWFLALPVMAAYMIWWGRLGGGYSLFGVTFGIQMFMLPALLPILLHTHSRIRINKWVFYLYYPAHLILIYLLDQFVF